MTIKIFCDIADISSIKKFNNNKPTRKNDNESNENLNPEPNNKIYKENK